MGKTAYFDPRGCDFWKDEEYISDVGNYRLVACVKTKTGEPIIIEFGGYQRREVYTKKNGKTDTRVVNENALHASGSHTCYFERPDSIYGPDAGTYGFNFEKELDIDLKQYDYTRADLMRFISDVTGETYTEIVFDGDKVDEQIEQIYKPVENELYAKARAERQRIEADKKAKADDARCKLREKIKMKQKSGEVIK